MHIDWISSIVIWIGFSFVSHCTEITRSRTVVNTKKSIRVESEVLFTRRRTVSNTRQSTTSDDSYNTLIKKLSEKSTVAIENQNLKVEVAKLEFKLALSDSKIRKLKNTRDELAASNSAMKSRLLILEQENLRLTNKETKLRRSIEDQDQLLDVISWLTSGDTDDRIAKLSENNLTGLEEQNQAVLRLLAASKHETFKKVSSNVGCDESIQASNDFANSPATVEVSQSTDETLADELHQPTSDSNTGLKSFANDTPTKGLWWTSANARMKNQKRQLKVPGEDFPPFVPEIIVVNNVLPPPAASPSFIDNRKVADVEYLLLSNLPPSVHGADIVEHFELMIGDVEQYTMFADENGTYSGTLAVVFVHPPDARRAYKTYDGL